MNGKLYYEEITLEHLDELADLYVETFNSEPWNDEWTIDTAKKRLHQIINTEDSYGICVYYDSIMCGGILGCVEHFYEKQNVKTNTNLIIMEKQLLANM